MQEKMTFYSPKRRPSEPPCKHCGWPKALHLGLAEQCPPEEWADTRPERNDHAD
jgi:hypothetical protein